MFVKCPFCSGGTEVEVTLEQQILLSLPRGQRPNISEILPDASADVRELFISGVCSPCWQKNFENDDENEGWELNREDFEKFFSDSKFECGNLNNFLNNHTWLYDFIQKQIPNASHDEIIAIITGIYIGLEYMN